MASLLRGIPAALGQGSRVLKPTAFLFGVDTLANAVDYVFHIYLGRALPPGDFGTFQTVNSALLIAVTAFGVMQPVLARFVAEAETRAGNEKRVLTGESTALFQTFLRWSALAGLLLGAAIFIAAGTFGRLINVPAYTVRYGALVVLLILLRPVVAGTLQGAQRFLPFGFTRLAYAVGRFAFAGAALALGAGLSGAVASLPAGQFLAVAAGFVFLGAAVFRRGLPPVPAGTVREGLQLAGWAFAAYGAFTALQNLDLLWVNRLFTPEESGAYAAAVLLRRILILFPGAAAVVMYPRIVASVARGVVPDRLLGWTLAFVAGSVLVLAAAYTFFGPQIVAAAFGSGYEAAGPLLAGMGAAMLAFGIGSVWLNLFLATRPAVFVTFLGGLALLQAGALSLWHANLAQIVTVFAAGGWLLAAAGAVTYWFWLRPGLLNGEAHV
jgi:O-antigen/teichoic acid export membrane protein